MYYRTLSRLLRVALTSKSQTKCLHKTARMASPIVPTVTEDTGVSEQRYDIFSRLLRDRIVMVMEPVSDELASVIVSQLLFLQSESATKPISMYINSPGGNVTAGMAIYDTMQYIQPPVATWCMGQACSMGSLLLAAGAAGMRYSLPNARIMIHQVLGGAQGQATDIHIHAKEILRVKSMLNNIYALHTKQSLDVIEASTERDNFMDPEQAKEFGLIDHVCSTTPVVDLK